MIVEFIKEGRAAVAVDTVTGLVVAATALGTTVAGALVEDSYEQTLLKLWPDQEHSGSPVGDSLLEGTG